MRHLTRAASPVVLLGAALALNACSAIEPAGEFSSALGKLVRSESTRSIDLSTVSPLAWDELFVFGPYSLRENSCKTLGLGWFTCWTTLPSDVNESEYVLVFRQKSKIVHVEHHSRANGDFSWQDNPRPQPILRSAAVFSILLVSNRAPQGQRWYRLEHQGLP
nr:hypothetical protein [uncultured Albidiferax sp.]